MSRIHISTPAALVVAFALSNAPAFAERPHGGAGHGGGGQAHATARAAAPRTAPVAGRAAAVPRVVSPRAAVPRVVSPVPGGVRGAPYYRGYYYGSYYSFRPRIRFGFGLWLGYPVVYPYPFYYPYTDYYPYPVPYPDPSYPNYSYPSGSISVTPGDANVGGLSFDITPSSAEVYVDGQAIGTVAQFGPTMPPLSVTPGRHYIEIRAAGYQPMAFDANIVPGQVLPYQGTMRPE